MRSEKRRAQRTMKPPATRMKPSAAKPTAARGGHSASTADILDRAPGATPSPERVLKKWRWHHRVLRALQSRLLGERGNLRRAAAEPLEPHSLDEADSATDEFDHDLALSELSAEQDAIYEVDQALSRIRNGTYGVCEESGAPIPAARLRAIPWARFTREIEECLEKKGIVHGARLNKAGTVRSKGQIRLAPEEEAEEMEEKPSAPPNDEALSRVFSPPGRHVARQKSSKRSPKTQKRKGRNT